MKYDRIRSVDEETLGTEERGCFSGSDEPAAAAIIGSVLCYEWWLAMLLGGSNGTHQHPSFIHTAIYIGGVSERNEIIISDDSGGHEIRF